MATEPRDPTNVESGVGVKLPLNRFVAFVKPYLNLLAGLIAAWLVAKVNVLGVPGLDEENVATWIAGGLAALLTAGLTQLGDLKWLKGHHIQMETEAAITAAALAPVPPAMATALLGPEISDTEAEVASSDVSDEVEFASPPTPSAGNMPVQPSQDLGGR
jgi:hypothetical protein